MPCSRASLRRAKPLLGTLVEISASGPVSADRLRRATDAAFSEISAVHALMSFHEQASDVSRLNRQAASVAVAIDPRTWDVLACAERVSRESCGAFDVTVARILVSWGLLPAPAAAPPPDPAATFAAVELLADHRVRFRAPLWIDLGGIAKGYAVDAACRVLRDHGIRDFVVNAGGDLAIGEQPAPVYVRDPDCPQALVSLGWHSNVALATSGPYYAMRELPVEGRHPIVEPKRALPARDLGSISVLAAEAMLADALTKVVAVSGFGSRRVVESFGAQIVGWPPKRTGGMMSGEATSGGLAAEYAE